MLPPFTASISPAAFIHVVPGRLVVEERLDAATIAALRARGHDLEVGEPWSEGRLSAVARTEDGLLRAAANPRGMQGYAVCR